MANCPFTISFDGLGCKDSSGGAVYAAFRTFSASTVYTYDANGIITGGTNTASTWYKTQVRSGLMEFDPGKGTHTPEGTNAWTTNLNFFLSKYQSSQRNLVYSLAVNDVEYFVFDNNGYYILGSSEKSGAYITDSDAKLGKQLEDTNGTNITIQSKLTAPARFMSSTFAALLTVV